MIISGCDTVTNKMMRLDLNNNWTFSQAGKNEYLPAKVPGTVHTDLLRHGKIPDFFFRANEDSVQWIEDKDWIYKTTFTISKEMLENENLHVYFEGLDTYTDVYLNDSLVLQTDNMFVGWDISCKQYLKEGDNILAVHFHSAVKKGMEKLQKLDYILKASNEIAPDDERTNVFTRKAPFHYGWDWGPRLVTCGIWRPVHIYAWNSAKIESVFINTESLSDEKAELSATLTLDATVTSRSLLQVVVDDKLLTEKIIELKNGKNKAEASFIIDNPELWWTNGLGEQKLYDVRLVLKDENGKVFDTHDNRIGLRTIKVVQDKVEGGRTFHLELNGKPIFMKGANYIPNETLTPSVTKDTYERVIQDAVEANMNMLRVWGGAIYENDYFYELCDEKGILVWQDFMFACALQPGDEEHLDNIRKEAEYNVKRLRNHPCIALWCGNNENLTAWHVWGWKDQYPKEISDFLWRTYERIFHEILPDAVNTYHPGSFYWASSPQTHDRHVADRKSGDEHDWTIWFGQKPFEAFGEDVAPFVSEYGLQALPDEATVDSFTIPGDKDMDSKIMRHRQRSNMAWIAPGFDGNDMILFYMDMYYGIPAAFSDIVYVSQLTQAKGYRMAIEAHRRNMPWCMGSLYWQLNDCWPTLSWATVDYYGNWKASHYASRKAFSDVLIAPVTEDDSIKVFLVSDRMEKMKGKLEMKVIDFSGEEFKKEILDVEVEQLSNTLIVSRQAKDFPGNINQKESLVYFTFTDVDGKVYDNTLYFSREKELKLPRAKPRITYTRVENGYDITVSSAVFMKDFTLIADAKGFFNDNYFDVMPGEEKTIHFETVEEIVPEEVISYKVLNNIAMQ